MAFLTVNNFKNTVKKVGPNSYVVQEEIVYYSERLGTTITVLPGYETDLASIPWFYRWRFNPEGPWWRAAIIHDILYGAEVFSRGSCDEVLRDAMRDDGIGWYYSNVFYLAVRTGGGLVWTRHTPESKAEALRFLLTSS